jgi:hypothetical protein
MKEVKKSDRRSDIISDKGKKEVVRKRRREGTKDIEEKGKGERGKERVGQEGVGKEGVGKEGVRKERV